MISWHLLNNLIEIDRSREKLLRLFLSGVARRIAITMLALFSPIYIYLSIKGFGYNQTIALLAVFTYFLVAFLIKLITLIYSEDLSRKIGFKKTIRASIIPFIVFIPVIIYASSYPILFIAASILFGLHNGFFWWGYHGYFVKTAEKDHLGKSIGEANFLETMAVVLTPFVGSLVTSLFGFNALFIAASLFMVLSLILLGSGSRRRQRRDINFSGVISLIKSHKSISIAYIGVGGEAIIYLVTWPLFLFLFFGKVISLGVIVSLASFFAAIFATAIGKWVDKQGERKIVSIGSPVLAFSWLIRFFSRSFQAFVITDAIRNFGQRMVAVPLNALSYKKALEAESAKAILFYETTSIIGVCVALLILIAWVLLGGLLKDAFIFALLFSALPMVAVYKKRLQNLK